MNKNLDHLIHWHFSPYIFDTPSYENIIEKRESDNRPTHTNSYLGLWSCTFPHKVKIVNNENSMFGTNAYEIKYKDNVKTKLMRITEFYKMCCNIETPKGYIDLRRALIDDGFDVLAILDSFYGGNHLGEIITLNFDVIDSFNLIDVELIKDHVYRMGVEN